MSEFVASLAEPITVAPSSTVSTTVLKAEGANVVLFAFDAGEELSEHTAAMPVLLQALDGRMSVTTPTLSVTLVPGALLHLDTREPHSVLAEVPSTLMLTMLVGARRPPVSPAAD